MIQTRVIPVLLLKDQGIYKGKKFKNHRYIGDPINTVKIFNEKEVDELVILDIQAAKKGIDLDYVSEIVSEAFMPVAYGGGIDSLELAKDIFKLGIEKIIINSAVYQNDYLITDIADVHGSQSVVISVDVKKNILGKYQLYSKSGVKKEKYQLIDHIKNIETRGAGEIIISNIDHDGSLKGYDLDLLELVSKNLDIPVIVSCGAGTISHFEEAKKKGASALAAGSMFVYKGKQQGILINYPREKELRHLDNL
jgi:imidazole glycerol-phosphate synthase subunit HisF